MLAKAISFVRRRGLLIIAELTINAVLPFIIYSLLDDQLGDVGALLVSSAPPVLWSLAEFLRHRRVDLLSLLVLGGIALSVLAAIGSGSARMLQLREKLVTGAVGLLFLASAAVGRPLIYELALASMRRGGSPELERFERLKANPGFRRTMMLMTLVWGTVLLGDVGVGIALIYTLSVADYLLIGPVVGYATVGALLLWTYWYGKRMRRRGENGSAAVEVAQVPTEEQQSLYPADAARKPGS